jgi:hypothetical protein
MNALLVFLEYVNMPPRVQSIWKYEEAIGYMENQLFGNFFEKLFRQHTRLNYDTFGVLIRVVGPSLEQKYTSMRKKSL